MKVLIILLLTLSAGFSQKEYQLKDLIYENGIFSNRSSEELVNGMVYQNFKEKRVVLGNVVNGKKEGLWTFWYDNGRKIKEGSFEDGKLEGVWTYWNQRGEKESEGTFKAGKGSGLWIFWHPNGEKFSEGNLIGVKKDGIWTYWSQNGKKESEEVYEDGVLVSVKEWNEDGTIK